MSKALRIIVPSCVGLLLIAAANPDIEMTNLERTPTYSLHRVRVRTQEIPHYHAWHDSDVLLKQGGGILHLNGKEIPLKPGDRIHIPRNVPHYFVHTATVPYSEAEVIFTPPYDGQDRVPVNANAVEDQNPGWRTRLARALGRFFQIVTLSFVF